MSCKTGIATSPGHPPNLHTCRPSSYGSFFLWERCNGTPDLSPDPSGKHVLNDVARRPLGKAPKGSKVDLVGYCSCTTQNNPSSFWIWQIEQVACLSWGCPVRGGKPWKPASPWPLPVWPLRKASASTAKIERGLVAIASLSLAQGYPFLISCSLLTPHVGLESLLLSCSLVRGNIQARMSVLTDRSKPFLVVVVGTINSGRPKALTAWLENQLSSHVHTCNTWNISKGNRMVIYSSKGRATGGPTMYAMGCVIHNFNLLDASTASGSFPAELILSQRAGKPQSLQQAASKYRSSFLTACASAHTQHNLYIYVYIYIHCGVKSWSKIWGFMC